MELIKKHAAIIVAANKSITQLWQNIDHYQQYGAAMQKNKVFKRAVEDLSMGEIVTACFTLPPYITKGKKKLETMPNGPEKLKLQAEIEIKIQELNDIKSLR